MSGERLTLRQKLVLGIGTLGVAWSGAVGFTGYKYAETRSAVNDSPILRTHDQLAAANEHLDHENSTLICSKGCIFIPEVNPDREAALGNLHNAVDSSTKEEVSREINGILAELEQKKNSSNQSYFKEDRRRIDNLMNKIEDDSSFVNIRQEREAYKTALIVLSSVAGVGFLAGATVGALELYGRKRYGF